MQEFIVDVMERFGYLGMSLLIAIENLFPPIPSEVILTFGGFMTTCTALSVVGVVFYATLGSVAGAMILYGVGRALPAERLERILDRKWCRALGFKKGDVLKTAAWFDGHGRRAVLLGRCVPIIRSLISIPAGMAKMDLYLFFLFTTAGSLVWNTVLVCLGAAAGASWEKIAGYAGAYSNLLKLALFAAAVVLGVRLALKKRRQAKQRGK